MFTGIIESLGAVEKIVPNQENLDLIISSPISSELKPDQSVNHNGCCLTVTAVQDGKHTVTAVQETISKTNISSLEPGDAVNLERAMEMGGRFDGHIVQGHVDQVATITDLTEEGGSWKLSVQYSPQAGNMLVEKGSVCLNGVSLTLFDLTENTFSVAIIPFTYEHTNFNGLSGGDTVNMEFDIVGKYVAGLRSAYPAT